MSRSRRRAPSGEVKNRTVRTISDAFAHCPFRSLVSIIPGTQEELIERVGAAFAAIGGEVDPIQSETLADLVNTVRCGQTVVVFGNRRELRDAAKSQLMAAVNAAMVGADGCA